MNYTLAGFTFSFTQDGSGNVTEITTPAITIGALEVFPAETLTIDPAATVAEAEAIVRGILLGRGLI